MWYVSFGVIVLALSAVVFAFYRSSVCRYERKVIEEYEEARRCSSRRQGLGESRPGPTPQLAYVPEPEDEEFRADCADVLAQLDQQRREWRRYERLTRR